MTRSASQRLHFLSRPFISNDYARQPHVNGLSTASAICAPGGVTRGLNCVFRQFMEMLQTAFRTGPFSFINALKFLENALTQQHDPSQCWQAGGKTGRDSRRIPA